MSHVFGKQYPFIVPSNYVSFSIGTLVLISQTARAQASFDKGFMNPSISLQREVMPWPVFALREA